MVNQEYLEFNQDGNILEVDFLTELKPREVIDITLQIEGVMPDIKSQADE